MLILQNRKAFQWDAYRLFNDWEGVGAVREVLRFRGMYCLGVLSGEGVVLSVVGGGAVQSQWCCPEGAISNRK